MILDVYNGSAFVLGDHIDSERLHPASFFSLNAKKVKEGLFQGMPDEIQRRFKEGSIIFGGRNFGCGSSREVIVQSLALNGVKVIVAKSFGRIFYRNAINNGILLIEKDLDPSFVDMSDSIELNIKQSKIINRTKQKEVEVNINPIILKMLRIHGSEPKM